jgi:hypothetical protein
MSDSIANRMVRAARLEVELYEEVEADTRANRQAFTAVLIASLATGIGVGVRAVIDGDSALDFVYGLLIGLGTGVAGWLVWALIAYVVGTTIFKTAETEATYGQLLRTLGFAESPKVFRIFAFVPFVGGLIQLTASVWALVAGIIAIRQALDFSTWRAIGTAIVGWVISFVLLLVVSLVVFSADLLF